MDFKLQLSNDIRRVHLAQKPSTTYPSLQVLCNYAKTFYTLNDNNQILFKYYDSEGDLITTTTDSELHEGFRCMIEDCKKIPRFYIYLDGNNSNDVVSLNTHTNEKGNESDGKEEGEEKEEEQEESVDTSAINEENESTTTTAITAISNNNSGSNENRNIIVATLSNTATTLSNTATQIQHQIQQLPGTVTITLAKVGTETKKISKEVEKTVRKIVISLFNKKKKKVETPTKEEKGEEIKQSTDNSNGDFSQQPALTEEAHLNSI